MAEPRKETIRYWHTHIKGRLDIDPMWNDFQRFYYNVGDKQPGKILVKLVGDKPLGKDNFMWFTKENIVPRGNNGPSQEYINRTGKYYLKAAE